MTSGRTGTATLQWVVHDGRNVHVSTFAGIPPGRRPIVTCPECGGPLTLRLGSERVHHAAHHPGALCSLTQPESALHHNAKMYFAQHLQQAQELVIEERCIGDARTKGGYGCRAFQRRPWLAGWEQVQVERDVNGRRPDVTLLRGSDVVGALEVWVSHRIEPEKKGHYAEWGIPWIEVAASEALIAGDHAWRPDQPLPVAAHGPGEPFRCEACARIVAELARAEAEAAEEARRRDEEARLAAERREAARRAFVDGVRSFPGRLEGNGVLFRRVRVFDRFGADATVFRDALVIADVHRDGTRVDAFVGVLGDLQVLERVSGPPDREAYLRLNAAGEAYLDRLRGSGMKVDAPLDWFRVLEVLDLPGFVDGWIEHGASARWPADPPPPAPWRVEWQEEGVDSLDLLRHFFVTYLAGLPVRYKWVKGRGEWWQPPDLAEEVWRLSPPGGWRGSPERGRRSRS